MGRSPTPFALLLALAAAGPGCAIRPSEDGPALLVGRAADAISLDPARVTDAESVEVSEQVFEHLVRARKGRSEIEPELATSWTVSPTGTEWTFQLRPNVRFHDGTPFDADAVIYSIERQRDPRHPDHRPDFAYEGAFRNIVRLEKVGPLAVRIVIERAYAPFLANLSMFPMSMVSPTAVRRWGAAFGEHPVGTGPFRFVEWAHGERITLEANPSWWGRPSGPAPHRIKHLAFVPVRDPRQRLVELEGGAIDVAESLAPQDLQFIGLHPELSTERVAGNNVGYLAINTLRTPFDDVRVRRAVAHAIHKEPIVKLVYQGLAVPASGPLAPTVWGRIELPPERYDPMKARALLEEAGWFRRRPATRPRLFVTSTPRAYMPAPEQVARMVSQNLRDVGMEVETVVQPIEAHLRATSRGEHDLCLLGWSGDHGDPDNFLYTLFHSDNAEPGQARNRSFLHDHQLDGILRWAQESLDRPQREQYYARAQRILAEEVPWVPIAHSEVVVARRHDVGGLLLVPSSVLYFRDATVERR